MKTLKFILLIAVCFIIVSCHKSETEYKHIERILVTDFCKKNIIETFKTDRARLLGIDFEYFDFSTKYHGSENMVGYAIFKSRDLTRSDLISFINNAMHKCYPFAEKQVALSELTGDDFYSDVLKQSAILSRLDGKVMHIYFREGQQEWE